jgi:hypothetical protein
MVRGNRHVSAHLFGAICPARGVAAAIIMPGVNIEAMNVHLKEIATQVEPGAHTVLVLDRAGWHQWDGAALDAWKFNQIWDTLRWHRGSPA